MQMLTIALLKEKGLSYLAQGKLGARDNHGCVYHTDEGKRCIAGATFSDDTLQEIDEHCLNEGTSFFQLLDEGIVSVPDGRTKAVYEVSQAIHDAWAVGTHIATSGLDDSRSDLTNEEDAFLIAIGKRTPNPDDLRAWLELIS